MLHRTQYEVGMMGKDVTLHAAIETFKLEVTINQTNTDSHRNHLFVQMCINTDSTGILTS